MKDNNENKIVSKRIVISEETYKKLKIKTIELELDDNDKITPKAMGLCIEALLKASSLKDSLTNKTVESVN